MKHEGQSFRGQLLAVIQISEPKCRDERLLLTALSLCSRATSHFVQMLDLERSQVASPFFVSHEKQTAYGLGQAAKEVSIVSCMWVPRDYLERNESLRRAGILTFVTWSDVSQDPLGSDDLYQLLTAAKVAKPLELTASVHMPAATGGKNLSGTFLLVW